MKEKLIFLGDSNVDAGRLREDCADGLGFGFVARLAEMLPGDRYELINRGHNGFTIRDVWRNLHRDCKIRESSECGADRRQRQPACVTVLAGVNNIPMYFYENHEMLPASFCQEYRQLLAGIRELFPEDTLILAEPFAFGKPEELLGWRLLLKQESDAIRGLAVQCGAVFLPLQECLDLAADRYGTDEITPDGVHLTAAGSRILAEQWLTVFRKAEPAGGICG